MAAYDTSQLASTFTDKECSDTSLEQTYRAIDAETSFSVETVGGERIIRVSNETGEGIMRFTTIMPGVHLAFNDFNMSSCFSRFSSSEGHLSVNYCKSGRIEEVLPGGSHSYMSQGDFKIFDFEHHAGTYYFPTRHYQSIAIDFDIKECQTAFARAFDGFSVDVTALRAKYCQGHVPYIIHDFEEGERIFGGLYDVGCCKFKTYAQVAALDTLVILDRLEYRENNQSSGYFSHAQVEKAKRAASIIVDNLARSYTVEQLSELVGLPITTFKTCFKGVFGSPPYGYLRAHRMDRAAQMLRDTNQPIADIGVAVGYNSPSKFSAAFKTVMGQTPSQYRRSSVTAPNEGIWAKGLASSVSSSLVRNETLE